MNKKTFACVLLMMCMVWGENVETAAVEEKTTISGEIKAESAENTEASLRQAAKEDAVVETSANANTEADEKSTVDSTGPIAETGGLKIVSEPVGAAVLIDKADMGKAPVTVEGLKPGKHSLTLKKPGYFLKRAKVNVSAGKVTEVKLSLMKPVFLKVTSSPVGASISLNGKKAGTTPFSTKKLKPADYKVSLSLDGYETAVKNISLVDKAGDSLAVTLISVERPAPYAADSAGPESRLKGSLVNKIALALFLAFSLGIVIVELSQSGE